AEDWRTSKTCSGSCGSSESNALPVLESDVWATGPVDRRVFDPLRQHARVANAAVVDRFDRLDDWSNLHKLLEYAECPPLLFAFRQTQQRSRLSLRQHKGGVDSRLDLRRSGCGRSFSNQTLEEPLFFEQAAGE